MTTATSTTETTTTEGDTRSNVLAFPTAPKRPRRRNPVVSRDELPENAVWLNSERHRRTPPMTLEMATALAVTIGRDLKDEVAFLRYRLDYLTQDRAKTARRSSKRGA